jgi:hypothetical protein
VCFERAHADPRTPLAPTSYPPRNRPRLQVVDVLGAATQAAVVSSGRLAMTRSPEKHYSAGFENYRTSKSAFLTGQHPAHAVVRTAPRPRIRCGPAFTPLCLLRRRRLLLLMTPSSQRRLLRTCAPPLHGHPNARSFQVRRAGQVAARLPLLAWAEWPQLLRYTASWEGGGRGYRTP